MVIAEELLIRQCKDEANRQLKAVCYNTATSHFADITTGLAKRQYRSNLSVTCT